MTLLYPLGSWLCFRSSGCGAGIFFLVVALQLFFAAAGQEMQAPLMITTLFAVLALPLAAYIAAAAICTYIGPQIAVREAVLTAFAVCWVLSSAALIDYLDAVIAALRGGSILLVGAGSVQLLGKILWVGAGGAAVLLLIPAIFELALCWWGDGASLRLMDVGRSLRVLLLVALGAMGVDYVGDFAMRWLQAENLIGLPG